MTIRTDDNKLIMKISTQTATQYQDIDSGQTLLTVPWEVTDEEGVVVHSGNQSFPLTVTADEVKVFLEQTLQVYQDDLARFEATQDFQAALDNATEVSAEISNLTI